MSEGDIYLIYTDPAPSGQRPLTERGERMRSWLPTFFRATPEYLAVIHSHAKEFERLEAAAREVREQGLPQRASVLLGAWEGMLRISVNPPGMTLDQRRRRVLAQLARMGSEPSGRSWRENVTLLVGAGWSYEEYIPERDLLVNYAKNPKLADDAALWSSGVSSSTTVIAQGRAAMPDRGDFGYRLAFRTDPGFGYRYGYVALRSGDAAAEVPVTPGETLSFSVDVYAADPPAVSASRPGGVQLGVDFYSGGGIVGSRTGPITPVPQGDRRRLLLDGVVVPPGATTARVRCDPGSLTAEDTIDVYFTRFMVTKTLLAVGYHDGDDVGWDWTGTADASTSRQDANVPVYTLRVMLPYPPESALYATTERLLRDITPAHLDLVVGYEGGFVLDESQLDEEPLP